MSLQLQWVCTCTSIRTPGALQLKEHLTRRENTARIAPTGPRAARANHSLGLGVHRDGFAERPTRGRKKQDPAPETDAGAAEPPVKNGRKVGKAAPTKSAPPLVAEAAENVEATEAPVPPTKRRSASAKTTPPAPVEEDENVEVVAPPTTRKSAPPTNSNTKQNQPSSRGRSSQKESETADATTNRKDKKKKRKGSDDGSEYDDEEVGDSDEEDDEEEAYEAVEAPENFVGSDADEEDAEDGPAEKPVTKKQERMLKRIQQGQIEDLGVRRVHKPGKGGGSHFKPLDFEPIGEDETSAEEDQPKPKPKQRAVAPKSRNQTPATYEKEKGQAEVSDNVSGRRVARTKDNENSDADVEPVRQRRNQAHDQYEYDEDEPMELDDESARPRAQNKGKNKALSPEEEEMALDPEANMDDEEVRPPYEPIERAAARARVRGHSRVRAHVCAGALRRDPRRSEERRWGGKGTAATGTRKAQGSDAQDLWCQRRGWIALSMRRRGGGRKDGAHGGGSPCAYLFALSTPAPARSGKFRSVNLSNYGGGDNQFGDYDQQSNYDGDYQQTGDRYGGDRQTGEYYGGEDQFDEYGNGDYNDPGPSNSNLRRARESNEYEDYAPARHTAQHSRRSHDAIESGGEEAPAPPKKRVRHSNQQTDVQTTRVPPHVSKGQPAPPRPRPKPRTTTSSNGSGQRTPTPEQVPAGNEQESQPKRRRTAAKALTTKDKSFVEKLREREEKEDETAQLVFNDQGDLANLSIQNNTLHECVTIAGAHYIAVVVYTQETPFPEVKNGREAAGEILGGVALGMAAKSRSKYKFILARVENKDELFISTLGKYMFTTMGQIWKLRNIFRPKGPLIARNVIVRAFGLEAYTGARLAAAVAALLQDNNFVYRGELRPASSDPRDTRMVYFKPAWVQKIPYSSDPYPVIIAQTFMGQAEKAGDGWNFPEDVFPLATHLRAGHTGPRPRQIPVPMVVYVTMAIHFALSELQNGGKSMFKDSIMRSLYKTHLDAHYTYEPESARSFALQYLYAESRRVFSLLRSRIDDIDSPYRDWSPATGHEVVPMESVEDPEEAGRYYDQLASIRRKEGGRKNVPKHCPNAR
ncbi:hypothetical protein PENSPDRAFT_671423 [Peniophora sp. CONT]|nr:hypothetical protein PENSPDRAFT_671423 [Peniophora sp. CONT]